MSDLDERWSHVDDAVVSVAWAGVTAEDVPSVLDGLERLRRGLQSFAQEMRDKGIHVGLGKPGRCVTCDEPWPCAASVAG